MPIQQDFIAYQESIALELNATQNKVRNLIGDRHWLTDGEHKEAALRNILRSRLPETVRIGKGFVCFPNTTNRRNATTGQLDILITSKGSPTLYKDGELVFVTADAVEAIIEVKTTLRAQSLSAFSNPRRASIRATKSAFECAVEKLSNQVEFIRRSAPNKRCWVGLFVYEEENVSQQVLLKTLQSYTNGDVRRAIDCVSIGANTFAHFWSNGREQVGSPIDGPVWHSYSIERLAPAYFISNMALHIGSAISDDAYRAWFPIENGKESHHGFYAALDENVVHGF